MIRRTYWHHTSPGGRYRSHEPVSQSFQRIGIFRFYHLPGWIKWLECCQFQNLEQNLGVWQKTSFSKECSEKPGLQLSHQPNSIQPVAQPDYGVDMLSVRRPVASDSTKCVQSYDYHHQFQGLKYSQWCPIMVLKIPHPPCPRCFLLPTHSIQMISSS